MPDVGVRELKTHTSEILRQVREKGVRYTITYRGRPVGILGPLEQSGPDVAASRDTAWEDLVRLGQEIGRGWQSSLSSVELLSEMRR